MEREAQRQRELEAAQKLAEAERLRAIEQGRAAQRLRRRALYLSLAVVVALGMALAAVAFGRQASRNASLAGQNLSAAQSAGTQAVAQRSTAESANLLSQAQKATAEAARAQAVGETNLRATSEAVSAQEAAIAELRALSAEAINKMPVDMQLSLLLALQAVKTSNTREAQNALHQVFQASRLRAVVPGNWQPNDASNPGYDGVAAVSPLGDRFAVFYGRRALVNIWKMGDSWAEIGPSPLITITNPIAPFPDFTYGDVIAFSPDGSLLAAVGINNIAKIWDARTGNLLHTLAGHTDLVNGVFFSPDGQWLATTSYDHTVKIWDTKTGQPQATLTDFTDLTYAATFSPDGNTLVTGSGDQSVIFWDVRGLAAGSQPRAFFTLPFVGKGTPGAISFSPDGKRLAIGVDNTGWVYEIDFSQAVPARFLYNLIGHQGNINSIVFSPDGKRLVTAAGNNTPGNNRAKIWDADTGLEQYTLAGETNYAAFSPDGNRLLTSSGGVQIWDVSPSGNQELFNLPGFNMFYFSPDGKRWLSVDNERGFAQFWESSPPAPWRRAVLRSIQAAQIHPIELHQILTLNGWSQWGPGLVRITWRGCGIPLRARKSFIFLCPKFFRLLQAGSSTISLSAQMEQSWPYLQAPTNQNRQYGIWPQATSYKFWMSIQNGGISGLMISARMGRAWPQAWVMARRASTM